MLYEVITERNTEIKTETKAMKKNNLIFAIIAIAIVLVSCDRNKVYEEFV